MATTKQATEGSTNDSLVSQEAKVFVEKLNLALQVPTTSTVQQPTQLQDAVCDDINETSSEFSGYSMVTPSATSTSELEAGKPLPGPQAREKVGVEGDGVFHAPQLGAGEFNIDIDASNNQQHEEIDTTANKPSKDDNHVLHTERESVNQKPKLIGMLVTFDHGVDSDEGLEALQYIGSHLAARLGSQVGNVNVLSIDGQGQLEVEVTPHAGPEDPPHSNDRCGEHVVTLRCMNEKCTPQDQPQESARIVSTMMFPFSPSVLDPMDTPAILPDSSTWTFPPTELEQARILRVLLGSKIFSCSGISVDKIAEDAVNSLGTISSNDVPTLSQLIDIAKFKIFRDLTKHEHVNSSDSLEPTAVGQKTSKIEIRSLKGKTAMRWDRESFLIVITSALMLTVISLVLCIVGMSAKAQGHCVGIWLGS